MATTGFWENMFPVVTGSASHSAVLLFVCFPNDTPFINITKHLLCGRKWPIDRVFKEKLDPVPALSSVGLGKVQHIIRATLTQTHAQSSRSPGEGLTILVQLGPGRLHGGSDI